LKQGDCPRNYHGQWANGPEFAGRALNEWAYHKGVKLNFFCRGLYQGAQGRMLNENWFMKLSHAGDIIKDCRTDYNEVRPYNSLNGRVPMEYTETATGL